MNFMKAFQKAILNKWLVSVLLAVMIFVLIPKQTEPIKSSHELKKNFGPEYSPTYMDLNGDGEDEMFLCGYFEPGKRISLIINNYDGATIEQKNLYDIIPVGRKPYYFFSDTDQDGLPEIILPYFQENTMSLMIWDFFSKDSALREQHYTIREFDRPLESRKQLTVEDLKQVDFNLDGHGELLFSIYGGYKFYRHRQLALLDLQTGHCLFSKERCNNISKIFLHDFDEDGIEEITGLVGSPDNSKPSDSCAFPDQDAFFMVYNQNLELMNAPPVIKGPSLLFNPFEVRVDDSVQLMASIHKGGDEVSRDYLLSIEGLEDLEFIDSLGSVKTRLAEYQSSISDHQNNLILFSCKNGFEIRGLSGEVIAAVDFDSNFNQSYPVDYNQDGVDEILVYNKSHSTLRLYSFKGKLQSTLQLNYANNETVKSFGVAFFHGKFRPYLSINESLELLTFKPNWFHYGKWLLIIVLFIAVWGFIEIILWTQRKQIEERQNLELQVKKLQVQSVKNQLDPHFTFNALNVLSFLAKEDNKEGLDQFVLHFSKLLRRQVETSDKAYTTLYDELRFVDHYIELQKLRFEQPIMYDLDVQGDLDMNLRIPKMMIHTHAENAIKHGLIPAGGGNIWVRIKKPNSHTQIEIENNGAPRSGLSSEKNGSTGKGLGILNQLYDLFYQLYKIRIKQEIVDLKDKQGNPKGTKVIIKL